MLGVCEIKAEIADRKFILHLPKPLGALPLVISTSTGSEIRYPLGITIVGGLLMSQVLTLYTTPVVYLYFDRLRLWWARMHKRKTIVLAPLAIEG